MKTMKSITLFALLLLCTTACRETAEINSTKNMLEINVLSGEATCVKGDKISYTGSVHGSVGTTKKCWSEDESILKLIDTEFKYNKPLVDGESGGDAAKEKYIFEAISAGSTKVIIQEWYRGDLENEYKVAITVVDK